MTRPIVRRCLGAFVLGLSTVPGALGQPPGPRGPVPARLERSGPGLDALEGRPAVLHQGGRRRRLAEGAGRGRRQLGPHLGRRRLGASSTRRRSTA